MIQDIRTISRCVTPLPGFTEVYRTPDGRIECTDIQMLASSCKLKAAIEPLLYPLIANGRLPGRPRLKGRRHIVSNGRPITRLWRGSAVIH